MGVGDTILWVLVWVCSAGAVAFFVAGMVAHVRDQQVPREATSREVERITRDRL